MLYNLALYKAISMCSDNLTIIYPHHEVGLVEVVKVDFHDPPLMSDVPE